MNSSLSVNFSLNNSSSNIWARLEQEYKKEVLDQTSLKDIYGMLSYASVGKSSLRYVKKECTYAKIVGDDKIVIYLDIFVWPSSLDLQYTLTLDLGEISPPTVLKLSRSFDIIFNNSNSEVIPYVFTGDLTPQMPYITPYGKRIPDLEPNVDGSIVNFDQKVCCVLRAEGLVEGHRYTVTMELDKTTGYKIENLNNTIVATWKNEDGEDTSDSLTLDIPECVTALLEQCEDGTLGGSKSCTDEACGNEPVLAVYYNTCNGKEILRRWEKNE